MRDRKYDFDLLDRFHAFGAEIVRLSLLAPGSVAFFMALAGYNASGSAIRDSLKDVSGPLGLSFGFFGIAILAGLAHRYISTDSLVCIIQRDRAFDRKDLAEVKRLKPQVTWRLKISGPVLGIAAISLACGSGLLLYSFRIAIGTTTRMPN
jgi:hypothetical protein